MINSWRLAPLHTPGVRQWSDLSPMKKNNIRTLTRVGMEWDFFLLSGAPAPPPRASLTIPHALSTFYISFYFTAAHSSKLNILTPPRFCQKSGRWTCATGEIQMESDKIQCEQQLYEMLSKIEQCLDIKTPEDIEQQELRIWRVCLYWDGSFRIRNIRHRLKWKGWILKAEVRRIN